MKKFLSVLIVIIFSLSVVAQKKPPLKNKVNNNEANKTKSTKSQDKKEVKTESDSTAISINMDKPLDQYFDSLNLTKEQIEKIAEIDEMQTKRDGMTRAKEKMTKAEISSKEKEDLEFRNNKIYDILTHNQIKEIFLLQNGKLKTGHDIDFIINHIDLKPDQQEHIKNIQKGFQAKFNEAYKIEDELERIKSLEKLNSEMEKNIKSFLDNEQSQLFDEIKAGKIDPTTDKEKKEKEERANESKKKE